MRFSRPAQVNIIITPSTRPPTMEVAHSQNSGSNHSSPRQSQRISYNSSPTNPHPNQGSYSPSSPDLPPLDSFSSSETLNSDDQHQTGVVTLQHILAQENIPSQQGVSLAQHQQQLAARQNVIGSAGRRQQQQTVTPAPFYALQSHNFHFQSIPTHQDHQGPNDSQDSMEDIAPASVLEFGGSSPFGQNNSSQMTLQGSNGGGAKMTSEVYNHQPSDKSLERQQGNNSNEKRWSSSSTLKRLEEGVVRKLDWHIMPLMAILYLFSYLDRVNIGNARLMGLEQTLNLSNNEYMMALSMFYFGYFLFGIPSNMMLVRFSPQRWIAVLMVLWGTFSLCLAFVTNYTGLIVIRFLLGAAEAGFVPGALHTISLFYKRSEQSFRMSIFFVASTLAGAFAGLIAAGISRLDGHGGLAGWQWIFIIESIPTLLLAIVTFFYLAGEPNQANYLTPEEKIFATNRILADTNAIQAKIHRIEWKDIRLAITDIRVHMYCLMILFLTITTTGIVFTLPSLINAMGFTQTTAQLLSAPPYLIAAVVALILPWWSDRVGYRGPFVTFLPLISLIGYLILGLGLNPWVRYFGTILVLVGSLPIVPIITSWLTNNVVGQGKRAVALAVYVSTGSISGMLGTQVYRSWDAPRYQLGHFINAGCVAVVIALSLLMRWMLQRENRRRDMNMVNGLSLAQYMSETFQSQLGDDHPQFRFVL